MTDATCRQATGFETLRKFMPTFRVHAACVVLLSSFFAGTVSIAQESQGGGSSFHPMQLEYRIEWRLVAAGTATMAFKRDGPNRIQVDMTLQSTGLLSHLYRVDDAYKAAMTDRYCLIGAHLDAQEGKKHIVSDLNVDSPASKSVYQEHDLVQNTSKDVDLNVASCTHDVLGALAAMGDVHLEPGKSTTVAITDGKKFARARIQDLGDETITAGEKKYQTTRYEAFLFDNVLYKRKGSLQIWVSNDGDRVPVLLRFQFGFPVGSVTVELTKKQDL